MTMKKMMMNEDWIVSPVMMIVEIEEDEHHQVKMKEGDW